MTNANYPRHSDMDFAGVKRTLISEIYRNDDKDSVVAFGQPPGKQSVKIDLVTLDGYKAVRKTWNEREFVMLSRLRHESIISLYGYCSDGDGKFMLIEHFPEGDLFDWLTTKQKDDCADSQAIFILRQLLRAVQYLHFMDVIHRDIKLDNVGIVSLFSGFDQQQQAHLFYPRVRLFDFEHACNVNDSFVKVICGTSEYVAPEVIRDVARKASDIYSLGVLAFALLTYSSYQTKTGSKAKVNPTTFFTDFECSMWHHPAVIDFLMSMLDEDPDARLSAGSLLNHRWMKTCQHQPYLTTGGKTECGLQEKKKREKESGGRLHILQSTSLRRFSS